MERDKLIIIHFQYPWIPTQRKPREIVLPNFKSIYNPCSYINFYFSVFFIIYTHMQVLFWSVRLDRYFGLINVMSNQRVLTLMGFTSKIFLVCCKALAFLYHMWRRRLWEHTEQSLGGYSTKVHGDTVDLRGSFLECGIPRFIPTDEAKINDLYNH